MENRAAMPSTWINTVLGNELESLEAGVSVNSTDELISNDDLCILKTSAVFGGTFNPNECKEVSPTDQHKVRLNPIKDSIIISRMNTPNLVGECGFVEKNYDRLFLPDRLWQTKFKPDTSIYPRWLNYLLNLPEFKLKIKGAATGTSNSMKNISKDAFLSLKILVPPVAEQQSIAQLLATWDTAISKTQELIKKKELQKKWLMQQLLTGKKRLKGFENASWKIQPLHSFIRPIIREVNKPSVPYTGIGLRSHGKGTFLKHNEQPEKNSMDKFYVVKENDLIVNITFAWEQAIAIVKTEDDGALASHRFPTYTFLPNIAHVDYFKFFILQPRMKYALELISPGGAGRNRVMSKSEFTKLEFSLPQYNEQLAIAKILQSCTSEIQLLYTQLDKLKQQKKGLMQVLLTGKKRLKITEYA